MNRTIKVRCYRSEGPGDSGCFQEYEVPIEEETSVQEVLLYIGENLDPTLTFFKHAACKQGLCARCTIRFDGKVCLACTTPIPGLAESITLEPVFKDKVLRDLLSGVASI